MFIREKRCTKRYGSTLTYLQLVEGRRVEGKVRQRALEATMPAFRALKPAPPKLMERLA